MSTIKLPSTEPEIDDWATRVAQSWIVDPQHASIQRQLEHKLNVDRLAAKIRKAGDAELAALRRRCGALEVACECAVLQLDVTAAPIEDMADRIGSQSWRDIANGCRKQASVLRAALAAEQGDGT